VKAEEQAVPERRLQKLHLSAQSLRFQYHTNLVWIAALQHIAAEGPAHTG